MRRDEAPAVCVAVLDPDTGRMTSVSRFPHDEYRTALATIEAIVGAGRGIRLTFKDLAYVGGDFTDDQRATLEAAAQIGAPR